MKKERVNLTEEKYRVTGHLGNARLCGVNYCEIAHSEAQIVERSFSHESGNSAAMLFSKLNKQY